MDKHGWIQVIATTVVSLTLCGLYIYFMTKHLRKKNRNG